MAAGAAENSPTSMSKIAEAHAAGAWAARHGGACKERFRIGVPVFIAALAQYFQPVDSQEIRIIRQRPPMQVGMFEQGSRLHLANFPTVAVHIASVINDPIRPL